MRAVETVRALRLVPGDDAAPERDTEGRVAVASESALRSNGASRRLQVVGSSAATAQPAMAASPRVAAIDPDDPALARVRGAGGPEDNANYSCGCGYIFDAPVSTTVACPHCGESQAW